MTFFNKLRQALGGSKKQEYDQWEAIWNARVAELTQILGTPSADGVFHSPMPLSLGGDADVLVFPNYASGVAYVTSDLTGIEDQPPSGIGNYELMTCARSNADWAPSMISRLAPYTLETVLNPGETMDWPLWEESQITALLFAQPGTPPFSVAGQKCGLLLCIGITKSELEFHHAEGSEALLAKLRDATIFPFTDPGRQSIV